ncbi:GNAT family N-acetyltransferase [Mucilaginibacter sp. PAMB04274]|uniref:GNAT family N-acetyltransferase n=1 Tax=Mucilaginibacter sp. PAMB04274 TaxID=3138568 RepID=UPI0031F6FC34
MDNLHIEQIRPELTWRLRRGALYPEAPLHTMEMDEDDYGVHFGAFYPDKLVGVVSLFQDGTDFQFRKFAVDPQLQNQGIGLQLLQYISHFALAQAGERIWCNARLSATGFYSRAGFVQTGYPFNKNGIEYVVMEKPLI